MDKLKQELERKRKILQGVKKGGQRFMKASELRRLQDDHDEAEREARNGRKRPREENKLEHAAIGFQDEKSEPKQTGEATLPKTHKQDLSSLTSLEISQRLRSMGLPILLFGEIQSNDETRRKRLQQALISHKATLESLSEKNEFRLGSGHEMRNAFLEKDESGEHALVEVAAGERKKKRKDEDNHEDEDVANDPPKRIYKYFKGLLNQWEEDLAIRPEDVKRSVAGKTETKTLKQCKDYIRPLFKMCKNRSLENNMIAHIIRIIERCEEGEFVKAHDAYLDVAIGRAPWPIGVTQVGIHARTGRAKIESQNVAHVMNSELQRKYLTSIKRLMTFAQNKRTDVLHSKKVL